MPGNDKITAIKPINQILNEDALEESILRLDIILAT